MTIEWRDSELVIRLYKMGWSPRKLADQFKCSRSAVLHLLRSNKIKLRKDPGGRQRKVKFCIPEHEYQTMSYAELAYKYNVSLSTVYNLTKHYKRKGRKNDSL